MAADIRPGKRERAEAYALEAADAERRGDHRAAAMLYQAAFLALESNDESLVITNLPVDDSGANGRPEADWLAALLGDEARHIGRLPRDSGGGEDAGD
jgi:hypothetical protein